MLFKYRLERPPEISSRDISKHSQTDGPIKKRDLIATAAARLRNMVRGGGSGSGYAPAIKLKKS